MSMGRHVQEHAMSTLDVTTLSVSELSALIVAAKAAEKAAKTVVKMPIGHAASLVCPEGKRPHFAIEGDLFAEPSVDNTYGKLLIGSSKMGNREYIPIGAIKGGKFDGCIVEMSWKARITPPEGYAL